MSTPAAITGIRTRYSTWNTRPSSARAHVGARRSTSRAKRALRADAGEGETANVVATTLHTKRSPRAESTSERLYRRRRHARPQRSALYAEQEPHAASWTSSDGSSLAASFAGWKMSDGSRNEHDLAAEGAILDAPVHVGCLLERHRFVRRA